MVICPETSILELEEVGVIEIDKPVASVIVVLVVLILVVMVVDKVFITLPAPPPPAASQVGRAEAPFEVRTWPDVPTLDTFCNAAVEVVPPQRIEYEVKLLSFVPPCATVIGLDVFVAFCVVIIHVSP